MYRVKFVKKSGFKDLEDAWHRLEQGQDMTYFQLYDWYKMLIELNQKNNWAHEIVFCLVVDSNGHEKMIAPLWIVKRFFGKRDRKGVYLFGRRGWNDYCNFIYDRFCAEALIALFQAIRQTYKITRYVFENLKTETSLYRYLQDNYQLLNSFNQVCIAVELPNNKELYLQKLSKHSKQNIRTAQNRTLKDGIKYIVNEDDKSMSIEEFQRFRKMRVKIKNKLSYGNLWFQVIKRLSPIVRYQFPKYTPMENDKNCQYISCRTTTNELMGAFCYGKDSLRHEIVIMAVSLNMAYKRYSPCMLAAYHYIMEHIGDPEIHVVNFTRGNEKYKYVLGGQEHYCMSFEIKYE